MRSHIRTVVVVVVCVALVALFLRNVDLSRVATEIMRARPEWLAFAVATTILNLAIRSYRWQYLLEPLGRPRFVRAFRATVVGFAASAILPARAGEVIRPYFLARNDRESRMTATGAFATIILERLLDVVTVIALLTVYVFVFGRDLGRAHPTVLVGLKWSAATASIVALGGFAALFVMAGSPEALRSRTERLCRLLPPALARFVGHTAEKFALGLGVVRRPSRLFTALVLSFPLWLSIALGIWGVAVAFQLTVPFTGTFLIISLLTLGVAVPTPGAVGGFHAAFRYGATTFFDAPDEAAVGAAIVLHLISVGPALVLGLIFAAQEGLNLAAMRSIASQAEPRGVA